MIYEMEMKMTKSQNTKSERLTEQWKKGELPEGHYYVKDGGNMIAEYLDGYFYNNGNPMTSFSGGVDEVLAPVPSYDEWKSLKNGYDSAVDANLEQATWMVAMEKENAQLKELLKECRILFNRSTVDGEEPNNGELIMILTKIDEVLGEK